MHQHRLPRRRRESDHGAAYAIAQSLCPDVAALTSANQQFNASSGLLRTTLTGLQAVSCAMSRVHAVLVKLADRSISSEERSQYQAGRTQYGSNIQDSAYQGKPLINHFSGDASGLHGAAETT